MGKVGIAGRPGCWASDFHIGSTGGILGGELALNEILLDFLQSLGFGQASGNLFVKLLHDQGRAGVVDIPQASHDGFDLIFQEEVADARDFNTMEGGENGEVGRSLTASDQRCDLSNASALLAQVAA